jgi:hypothetical protein
MRLQVALTTVLSGLLIFSACKTPDPQGTKVLGDEDDGTYAGGKLRYKEYEVRFTNPVCKDYKYTQPVKSNAGALLTQKPKDVFCSNTDKTVSGSRPEAPQYKLLSWINDPATKEIFFAYLSFSNSTVMKAVCEAVKTRKVKVTFVLDDTSDMSVADQLIACDPNLVRFEKRGHDGGIGYAHNKLFLINPYPENGGDMKLAFSSGNMTSGIVLHHENWHFITPERDTFFAKAHLCLVEGVLDHATSKADYASFIKSCKAQIAEPEETDVKTFFIPGEGYRATDFVVKGIRNAKQIRLAAHRFSYNRMLDALRQEMSSTNKAELQMVYDDDTYWAGHGDQTGDNESWEYDNVTDLVSRGAQARWMETNHGGHLLHHNKYLVFNMPQGSSMPSAVFGGAGNLTGTGFTTNFENFYYVEIPEVVAAYNKQYDHVWNDLATTDANLPSENVLPPTE